MTITRNTIQKTLVLEAVRALHCHATADEIYRYIREKHPNISKGTVYRNLNLMVEQGDIRRVELAGESDRFDCICAPHYHFKCVRCGRVYDVDMDYIPDLQAKVHDTHGFLFESHDIVFRGICSQCREQED